MNFGQLLKDARINRRLTLRQCSAQLGVDASNWSKIERDVNPAPKDIAVLEQWAEYLQLDPNERQSFFDAAALSRRELPHDLASNTTILQALPAFFRAVRGAEMSPAVMEQFVRDIRALHTADTEHCE